jgi:hypothetical protein
MDLRLPIADWESKPPGRTNASAAFLFLGTKSSG